MLFKEILREFSLNGIYTNYAAWLGIGGESSRNLDVGKSIFTDGQSHTLRGKPENIDIKGIMSLGMRIIYILNR